MKQNLNIEAEGSELILKNKAGDYVIIPKKYRREVQDMIKDNCHGCIDSLVETLPVMADYAEDGSLYSEYLTTDPPSKKPTQHPLDPNPDGSLPSYFEGSAANPIQLDEVTVTAKAPEWVKYRREYVKNNPFNIDEYVENRFNNPVGREKIEKIDQEGWRKKLKQEGLEKRYNSAMDYVGEQLVKNKPQGELSRAEWLNQMSDKEEELIKRNPKYQSSLWADTKRGLTSLVEQNSLQTFQNILSSSDYSDREKREMLKDYVDHPIMSKLGDAAKILNPLSVPSKMVQSAYKDDYSFGDALKGKKNKAGLVEDIITDPLNLVGLGIWGKLSKANKFAKLEDAYQAINTLDKASLEKQIGTVLSDEDWQYLYRVQEKNFDIEKPTLKAIQEKVEKGEGNLFHKSILNNPEKRAELESRDKYYGQWFEKDPKRLDYYLADKDDVEILRMKVPKQILEQYRIDKFDPEIAKKWSMSPETEYILPKDLIEKSEKFKREDWDKLINEHNQLKNLPKLEQIPLDFKIEDVFKNISSIERKNMEIMKKGNAYFKALDNPESLKRLKEFGDEYGIDLLDAYKKAEKRWDYGNNIGKNDRFQVAGEEVFKDDIVDAMGVSTIEKEHLIENFLSKDKKIKKDLSESNINYINKKADLKDYATIVWHELSHYINKYIISGSKKLQDDISNIFVKNTNEVDKTSALKAKEISNRLYKSNFEKSNTGKSIEETIKDELNYISKPTETWAFLSTNLRQDLKNTGVIKDYNELLTVEKLEQAIKNGNTVFSRFEPYIKDKDAFIKLFNKMTLSIAPAALYLQSQQNNKKEQ